MTAGGASWSKLPEPARARLELLGRLRRELSADAGGLAAGTTSWLGLGASLAPLGDLTGDGVPDVAVGAPEYTDPPNPTGPEYGSIHVLFLTEGATSALPTGSVGPPLAPAFAVPGPSYCCCSASVAPGSAT